MKQSLIHKDQSVQTKDQSIQSNTETDPVKRLENLNNKVKGFETQKIKIESELEMLKKQHSGLIEELKEYGIENVEDLPKLIQNLQTEFDQLLIDAENDVKTIEETISSLQQTA